MFYVDTSVLAAYYCPEPLSERVEQLLRDQVKPALSYLTEVELFSAVAKKVRTEEMGRADGNRIVAQFSAHLEAELFTMIPVSKHHWRLAKAWIGLFSTPLRTLDALHLAVASVEGLELVTSDKPLSQAAAQLGIKAHFIGEDS
jgi:predicted nucleic acid-binding protein